VPLLTRGRQGVLRHKPAARSCSMRGPSCARPNGLHEDLSAIAAARRPDSGAVEHHALTEFLPEALSSFLPRIQCQHRSGRAPERRDRRPYCGRCRHLRRRRRHSRCRRARDLSVPPDRFGSWSRRIIPWRSAPRFAFRGSARSGFRRAGSRSAIQRFLASKRCASGGRLRLRVQLRSFDAVCRLVECKVGVGVVPETTARRVAKPWRSGRSRCPTPGGARSGPSACAAARAADLRAAARRAFKGKKRRSR